MQEHSGTEILQNAYRYLAAGQFNKAHQIFASLQNQPQWQADSLNGQGLCYEAQGQVPQAEMLYRQALDLQPDEAEFLNNLAASLQSQGKTGEALTHFERLAEVSSEQGVLYNLASFFASQGQYWQAMNALDKLLQQQPLAEALMLVFEIVKKLFSQPQNLEQIRSRLAQRPDSLVFQIALSNWYDLKQEPQIATRYFQGVLQAQPGLIPAYRQLIQLLQEHGNHTQALTVLRRLFGESLQPEHVAEMITALQQPIPGSDSLIQQRRQHLLNLLEGSLEASQQQGTPQKIQIAGIPFFMSYQWGEDRPLQEKLAAFYQQFFVRQRQAPAHRTEKAHKPRLAMLSSHFYKHSVMDLLIKALSPLLAEQGFESWLLLCPHSEYSKRDQITEQLKNQADHSLELSEDIFAAQEQIASLELDLLIYPDLGMDAYTYALAMNRLARWQLTLPGHPLTSGLKSVDYFVSADVLEAPQAQNFYTEQLIRLPGMPDYQQPLDPPAADRLQLGLPEGHLYFCPMTPFKLLPAFDRVIAQILERDPQGQILFLEFKDQLHLKIRQRFELSYLQLSSRLHFLPWSSQPVFFQRLLATDVILDTFPFGGGNTSYQALGLGCPLLALDVPWMKGRWTQGMYRLMGISDLIAKDPDDYVEKALQVATDKAWQNELRLKIKTASQVLFDNPAWSEGLRDFCLKLAMTQES